MRDRESCEPTTVLDHLRPTVVVRRRVVVDVAALNRPKLESPEATERRPAQSSGCTRSSDVGPVDDSAPPSSMSALEADGSGEEEMEEQEEQADETPQDLPSVRESLDERDMYATRPLEPLHGKGQPLNEEGPATVERAPVDDSPPVIPVGPTIAIGTMAKRLGVSSAQVVAELVTRGFFEVTPATVISRDSARIVADAFGRVVEDVAAPNDPVRSRRKRSTRRAAPSKRASKPSKSKKRTAPGRSGKRAA